MTQQGSTVRSVDINEVMISFDCADIDAKAYTVDSPSDVEIHTPIVRLDELLNHVTLMPEVESNSTVPVLNKLLIHVLSNEVCVPKVRAITPASFSVLRWNVEISVGTLVWMVSDHNAILVKGSHGVVREKIFVYFVSQLAWQ